MLLTMKYIRLSKNTCYLKSNNVRALAILLLKTALCERSTADDKGLAVPPHANGARQVFEQ